jgi:hypothetical protein
MNTRTLVNMEACLKKKVFVPIESYDLYTTSCHPAIRKTPEDGTALLRDDNLPSHSVASRAGRLRILAMLRQDLRLLRCLDFDMGMRMEFANVSYVSDTDLTDTVSRGEQVRVYNKLTHFVVDNQHYVNKSMLLHRKPARFSIKTHPPTYADPPEAPLNSRLREECLQRLDTKLTYHTRLDHRGATASREKPRARQEDGRAMFLVGAEESKEAAEAEGGNVLPPSCGYWGEDVLAILDFKSLYPSIMIAYNISYENIVYDADQLEADGVEFYFVAINKAETVAVAKRPGLIPLLLTMLVESRNRVKRAMKKEPDRFRRSVMDKEQNSLKVLCNATYGFCGAGENNSLLAVKEVMYMVTSLGRYLQKFSANYLAEKYSIPTVYGDTDSIFELLPWHRADTIEEVCRGTARMYRLPEGKLTWEAVVAHFGTVDVRSMSLPHQVRAVLTVVGEHLCDELNALYVHPVVLELENLADHVWMGPVKKHYCYRMINLADPSKIDKIKVTGMPSKKRDWTPWTRHALETVTDMLLYDRGKEIEPFLDGHLRALVEGQVPIEQLRVSRSFKAKSVYKHYRQMHLQVVLKTEARTRWPFKEHSRVYYVVRTGSEKLYLRAETPEHVVRHGLTLDYSYYLKQQFYRPMKKLLAYNPELFNFERLFNKWHQTLEVKTMRTTDIGSCFGGVAATGQKRMTTKDLLSQVQAKRQKRCQGEGGGDKAAVASDALSRFMGSLVKRRRP